MLLFSFLFKTFFPAAHQNYLKYGPPEPMIAPQIPFSILKSQLKRCKVMHTSQISIEFFSFLNSSLPFLSLF